MPRGSNYRPAAQAELAGWGSSDRLEFRYSADHAQEGSVSSFDVRVFAIRRRPGRQVFEVRWRVAGGDKSRSFITRALADSYHAELIRAARRGLEFDPATGEPQAWAAPAPATVTWYQHAVAYAAMKWPHLAAHSRPSMAEALATVTPLTVASPAQVSGHPGPGRPDTPGPGGVLRLPVLRGAAPRRSRRPSPKPSHPPGARARGNDSHRRMPAHRRRMDQQWQAARAARAQAPPTGTVRIVPIPPILVSLFRQHIRESGTASDGRLFRSTRGGPLSESVYGRVWHAARQAALGPAQAATPLARRPYDLRHAALSLWLNASS